MIETEDQTSIQINNNSNVVNMEPQKIDIGNNICIVSDLLFDTDENNNVKAAYKDNFNKNELEALESSAQEINSQFKNIIQNDDNVKTIFRKIRLSYIKILKILNRKVKKFEVTEEEKNNLSNFEKAVIDQFEKIKCAITVFEHAEWNLKENTNTSNQTLENLIKDENIEFKLPQIEVKLDNLKSSNGCNNQVYFIKGQDGKSYVIKKDPFIVEKKSMKFNPFLQSSQHRKNKKIGVYEHFDSKGKQCIVDGVSRQKAQQTIAQAMRLDCVVKTEACLVNGEVWTCMEDAKNEIQGEREIFYGQQVLFCLDDNELQEAKDFIETKTMTVKNKNSKNLSDINVKKEINLKDYCVAKKITAKTLIAISEVGALDFICGQLDRNSQNFAIHFDKDENAKFKLFDNDSNFPVNLSESEMKQMLKEKVPIVPKSLAAKLLDFAKRYEDDVKPELEAQIGKVGDFENGQNTSKAVKETEKRIIMLFNHVFGLLFDINGEINLVIDWAKKNSKIDNLGNKNYRFIGDDDITVEQHGKLFLQLEPDGWFWWLLCKIFDLIRYYFYLKIGNLLSATHYETRKISIDNVAVNLFQSSYQWLNLTEEDKIKSYTIKTDSDSFSNIDLFNQYVHKNKNNYFITQLIN